MRFHVLVVLSLCYGLSSGCTETPDRGLLDDELAIFLAISHDTSFEQACAEIATLCEQTGRGCAAYDFFCQPSSKEEWVCMRLRYACRDGDKQSACDRYADRCVGSVPPDLDGGASEPPVAPDAAPPVAPDAAPPTSDTMLPSPDAGAPPPDLASLGTQGASLVLRNDFEHGWGDVQLHGFCRSTKTRYETLSLGQGERIPAGHAQFTRTSTRARTGAYSARVELNPRYACWDKVGNLKIRSEITYAKNGKPYQLEREAEYWIGYSLFLPVSNSLDNPPRAIMTQIRRMGTANYLRNQKQNWQYNVVVDGKTIAIDLGSIQKGVWTDFVFHLRESVKGAGLLEIWLDGLRKYSKSNISLELSDIGDARIKTGAYYGSYGANYPTHGDSNLPFVVFVDAMKVARGANGYPLVAPGG